ncbi:MAG: hypothetical protein JXL80_18245 [Planctomycetes bacterium]|nr:hypothetical protein [Planctomycetota bacterium]
MTWESVLSLVWSVVNSPVGIAAVAGLVLYILNRVYAAKPALQQYEGAIISAVKLAEKEIPDDTPNKGLARLNCALQYVLKVYQETEGKRASQKVAAELKDGIQVAHAELEAAGNL